MQIILQDKFRLLLLGMEDQQKIFKRKLLNKLYKEFMDQESEFISGDILRRYASSEEPERRVLESMHPFVPFEELRWIFIGQMAKDNVVYPITKGGKHYVITVTETK